TKGGFFSYISEWAFIDNLPTTGWVTRRARCHHAVSMLGRLDARRGLRSRLCSATHRRRDAPPGNGPDRTSRRHWLGRRRNCGCRWNARRGRPADREPPGENRRFGSVGPLVRTLFGGASATAAVAATLP